MTITMVCAFAECNSMFQLYSGENFIFIQQVVLIKQLMLRHAWHSDYRRLIEYFQQHAHFNLQFERKDLTPTTIPYLILPELMFHDLNDVPNVAYQ